jgi:hypothetical protein
MATNNCSVRRSILAVIGEILGGVVTRGIVEKLGSRSQVRCQIAVPGGTTAEAAEMQRGSLWRGFSKSFYYGGEGGIIFPFSGVLRHTHNPL